MKLLLALAGAVLIAAALIGPAPYWAPRAVLWLGGVLCICTSAIVDAIERSRG